MTEAYICMCCGERTPERDFIPVGKDNGACWDCLLGKPGCTTCVAEGLPDDVAAGDVSGDGSVLRPDVQ